MRKKRLFAFSLMIGLPALLMTLQADSARIATAQDTKVKQDGFITGCSETVIDALDECIQERFSKADVAFGYERVAPQTRHLNRFMAETQNEREAISELEKDGWQVAFYLVGRRVLGPKPDLPEPQLRYLFPYPPVIHGPIAITAPSKFEERATVGRAETGPLGIYRKNYSENEMIEEFELPEPMSIWDNARKAAIEFEKRDQYDFSFGKWSIAARPIRAKESCLKCHTGDPATDSRYPYNISSYTYPNGLAAPKLAPPKVGDALGVAMYAYARKR
jgi:hypothetical protein